MITVERLCRRFGDTVALENVSFEVASGEIVGFLGPNGAGKTTAMKILTGTLAPTAGSVVVSGHDVVTDSMAVRQQIGFMPEHVPLYPDSAVRPFLRFVGQLKGVPAGRLETELDVIEQQTGLREVRQRLIGHLSKGYRQRVGLAQALIGDPPLLILDEPTAGLDPHQIVEIRELIRACRGHKTVLLSSHILNEVSLVCERVLILDRGRLVAEEGPADLAGQLQAQPTVAVAWDDRRESVLAALGAVPGVAEVKSTVAGAELILSGEPADVRPLIAEAVVSGGGRLQNLTDRTPSLEELFLRLTARSPEDDA